MSRKYNTMGIDKLSCKRSELKVYRNYETQVLQTCLSESKFGEIIRYYAMDFDATEIFNLPKISRNRINKILTNDFCCVTKSRKRLWRI